MKGRPIRVCVVTTSRAEYGALRWTLEAIRCHPRLKLQLLATGAHLSKDFGSTYRGILADGFRIDAKVPMRLSSQTPMASCISMADCLAGSARALDRLKPDIVLVAGDRYELLPICSAALVLGIPIAHVSGGDETEGAIDNQVRHAVTKMAHIHFPGTALSARRVERMGEDPHSVFLVGEPGVESLRRSPRIGRRALAERLGLNPFSRWVLFTYHPETLAQPGRDLTRLRECLRFLRAQPGIQTILLDPNADPGRAALATELERAARGDPTRFRLLRDLHPTDFTNLMRHGYAMAGNSSAGLLEAPSARLAVIDVGDRQKGRLRAANVVHSSGSRESLCAAWRRIETPAFRKGLKGLVSPFGDGRTGGRIAGILARLDPEDLRRKRFHGGPVR